MVEGPEQGRQAWRPFSAAGGSGTTLLLLGGGLAALGVGLALVVMILWFVLDAGDFFNPSSGVIQTIQALTVVVQPLMMAALLAGIAALVVAVRERR